MLKRLHINNLGIIEDLEIEFDNGLNILTGETGAGKTLILGAIKMICGGKVNKDMIRNGEETSFTEALFYVDNDELKDRLKEIGYASDEFIIFREISKSGRSFSKVNGKMVTTTELKELGSLLIDLHGQHDNQYLLDPKRHIEVIDNFGGSKIKKLKEEYQKEYEERKRILSDIEHFGGEPEKRARTLEFLKFQLDEIMDADLKINEEEELEEKRKRLVNAEKIMSNLNFGAQAISGDNGATNLLYSVKNKLDELTRIDDKYSKFLEQINEVYYILEDVGQNLSGAADSVYLDEDELNKVDERIDLIFRLKRKYGKNIEEILNTKIDMEKEYNELCNSEERVEKLNLELKESEDRLREIGNKISKIRIEISSDLEGKLEEILKELYMPKSRFEIKVLDSGKFLTNGLDEIEILFSANLGEEVKPLSKVGSGGEISRIMLSLKKVLSNADIIPVMVFDEIDTGISGKAGFAVGEKMKEISKNKQVICVTHLPSITAKGDTNFYISKETTDNKTVTSVKKLNEEETILEIARIISGGNVTDAAILNAKEIRNIQF